MPEINDQTVWDVPESVLLLAVVAAAIVTTSLWFVAEPEQG